MQPFADIRVIDLTHVIAGPFCTYQLAVMGADVIKVEPVGNPDMSRQDGADIEHNRHGMGSMFMTQSANKRAIAVDLKTSEGQRVVSQLISTADVVVENYRPGALDALGLGYEDLKADNPALIYCSLTGFGQEGPMASRTAYDNVIQAVSGLMAATGDPDSGAVKVGPPVLDYGTGIQGAFAIAAALYQRKSSGTGQRIDLAMMDAALMLSGTSVTYLAETGGPPQLSGNENPRNAGYGCYETADGQLMLGAYTASQHKRLWEALGDPEHGESLSQLPSYALWDYAEADRSRIRELLLDDTADNWELKLNAAKVPAARVRHVAETTSLEHLRHRGVIQSIETHRGEYPLPVAGFTYAHDGPKIHDGPPMHGEHTRSVLIEAGFSDADIDAWCADGILYQSGPEYPGRQAS